MIGRPDNRVRIALHPEVFKMLETYKDKIHDHASKRRVPMSWNEFFMIIVNELSVFVGLSTIVKCATQKKH